MPYVYQPNYYGGAMNDVLSQYKGQYQMQPMPQQIPMQQPATNDMLFVLGEVEAMSYPVAPNNTVVLWDKDQHTVYIKSNVQGIPSMRILDYTERTATAKAEPTPSAEYVKMDAFRALEKRLAALEGKEEN